MSGPLTTAAVPLSTHKLCCFYTVTSLIMSYSETGTLKKRRIRGCSVAQQVTFLSQLRGNTCAAQIIRKGPSNLPLRKTCTK